MRNVVRLLPALLLCCVAANVTAAIIPIQNSSIDVDVSTWKELRDARIVKQDLDFSCGAASLATLLNEFYGQSLTEAELLIAMDQGDGRASFDDMARVLPEFGFRGAGYAASFEQLAQLKMPVIVYLKHRDNDHFSVLRGIDADTVWLADPSLGNRTYSRQQFLKMWETRDNEQLKGKFLAVLANQPSDSTSDFFDPSPKRQTAAILIHPITSN